MKVAMEYSVKFAQIRKERLQMKKKVKGIVGLCLMAALAVGGVGTYAYANPVPLNVFGDDNVLYYVNGGCSIGETSGSAYTAESGSAKCHCSVSATFWWYDSNGNVIYSNGNGAGGMHYASVTMTTKYTGAIASSVVASHTANATVGGTSSNVSDSYWPK